MKSLVRKNAEICLLSLQHHSVQQKGREKRRKKKHKGNNRGVARLQILYEKQPSFVLPLSPLWRMALRCADVHALSSGKGVEVKGEGSGAVEGP